MKKRYQIFISSTFADLKDERNMVMQAVLERKCFPAGMELFPAIDKEQFDYIKKVIDDSDYYLLIIGARYGSMDENGVSFTEKEYDYAVKKGIPVIAFLHNDIKSIPLAKADVDKVLQEKLEAFRGKVQKGRLVKYWKNAHDLKAKVISSLVDVFEDQPKIGWVRADKLPSDNEGTLKELKALKDERAKHQAQLREAQEKIKSLESELKNLKASNGTRATLLPVEAILVPGTDVSFRMVRVEGGTFMMGANEGDEEALGREEPSHQVTLSDYYIGETQVTQALWQAVMGKNPSSFTGDSNCPVESVSWNACQMFIQKLNSLTGMSFRLPTEAEWEFAARGGNKSKGYKYAGGDDIDKVAWYINNSENKTHPVAQKEANEMGLNDMSGNVLEWCQDRYSIYTDVSQTDPEGSETGSFRVIRGGSWYYGAGSCRVSFRSNCDPTFTFNYLGLRLAL